MNRSLFHLLIFSLVWLSADAAADSGSLGHAHEALVVEVEYDQTAAAPETDDQRQPDASRHCERCCHVHASVLPSLLLASDMVPGQHFAKPANLSRQAGAPPPPVPPPIV